MKFINIWVFKNALYKHTIYKNSYNKRNNIYANINKNFVLLHWISSVKLWLILQKLLKLDNNTLFNLQFCYCVHRNSWTYILGEMSTKHVLNGSLEGKLDQIYQQAAVDSDKM